MNILIAEDSSVIQVIHRELMRCWGYDFDIASNGIEAVSLAQKNNGKYDFCLMDIQMPKMNGIEAARIIRKTVEYFPIMALTSNDDCESECYEAGMDGFAQKPCFHEDLFEKIKKLSVKIYKLITKRNGLDIIEVMPVDRQHAEELRELAKQGLCKMRLRGSGAHDVTFTVHKNVPYSISHDFIEEESEVTTFIDRDEKCPAECYVYKSSCLIPAVLLDGGEYAEKCKQEDLKMEYRKTLVEKKSKS
ncbi:MAG: response regulator [Candidatus Thiodiazotropha sp. (ex Dulcina madagascariensis)]|nr:response regulator [Candidatus Thiodiazotropha sp. (ex Dulcina madagascariensis)]